MFGQELLVLVDDLVDSLHGGILQPFSLSFQAGNLTFVGSFLLG